ncbi:chromosome transmission fidelity protein 8-like isoform X2 [Achlya hypogyna]|uniref:Chromosome transmission fidelity protein 8-like isoform X2 n=1 Tax=Achlya hypogyna TaxID=1202772 RepID=A0A1V9YDE7_ACHHY|nr:chromosome transmission fidelity protein 8-like isoform X2 [Achlya hypogyna]
MRIPLRVSSSADGKAEWSIVELQGELISETKASLDLGQLEYKKGVPTLLIGNHLLEGKITKLVKPMAIMRKEGSKDDGPGTAYTVVGIARKKLIFNTRPKPVLT